MPMPYRATLPVRSKQGAVQARQVIAFHRLLIFSADDFCSIRTRLPLD